MVTTHDTGGSVVSTATREAVEIEHLDWHGVECGWAACANTAAWWVICLNCAAHTPSCDPCRRHRVPAIEPTHLVRCNHCHRSVPASRLGALFTFVPIGA